MSNTPELKGRQVGDRIYFLRGRRVMIDSDLAELYGVETKHLNKAVNRNLDRFPEDFMFRLLPDEVEVLRFQSGTSSSGHGGRRFAPFAFTQEGVAMLSGVLRSDRAVKVNIEIMRAFVRLRVVLDSNQELARKVLELERKYDQSFKVVFDAIRRLMQSGSPPTQKRVRGLS